MEWVRTKVSECQSTLCLDTAEHIVNGLHRAGKTEIPTDAVPIVKYSLHFKGKRGNRINRLFHTWIVVLDSGTYFLVDSWEGMHKAHIRPISPIWFSHVGHLIEELATGTIRMASFEKVFGIWAEERAELKRAGMDTTEYTRDATLTDVDVRLHTQGFKDPII